MAAVDNTGDEDPADQEAEFFPRPRLKKLNTQGVHPVGVEAEKTWHELADDHNRESVVEVS